MRKVVFQISKIIHLWADCFVVPSLHVATKTNLGFIPFLTLCCDIFSTINLRLGQSFVATEQECRNKKM